MALTKLTKGRARWSTFKLKVANAVSRALYEKLIESGISITDFGALDTSIAGNETADSSEAFRQTLLFSKTVIVPPGRFRVDSAVSLSANQAMILGTKGKSVLLAGGDNRIFEVGTAFTAQDTKVQGITFSSVTEGEGTAVGSTSASVYISHWNFEDCWFDNKLKYGVDGNLIGSTFEKCLFGFHGSTSRAFQPIRSYGTSSPVRNTNINKFHCCEFARCTDVTYLIEFSLGIKAIFDTCIFEANSNFDSIVRMQGVYYPEFKSCWFENNDGKSLIKSEAHDGIDSVVVSLHDCILDCSTTLTDGVLDLAESSNRAVSIKRCMFARGSTRLAKAGGDPVLVGWEGNYSTNTAITARAQDPVQNEVGVTTTDVVANTLDVDEIRVTGDTSTRITRTLVLNSNGSATTTLPVPYTNQQAGGLCIVRGTHSNGRSFCTVYNLAIRFASGDDITSAVVSTVGSDVPVTFAVSNGNVRVTLTDAGYAAVTFIGF